MVQTMQKLIKWYWGSFLAGFLFQNIKYQNIWNFHNIVMEHQRKVNSNSTKDFPNFHCILKLRVRPSFGRNINFTKGKHLKTEHKQNRQIVPDNL